MTEVWPDARTEQLKTLFDAGLSASRIAAEIGCGITRNAVIGKAMRLGLERDHKIPVWSYAFKVISGIKRQRATRAKREAPVCQDVTDVQPLGLPLLDLAHDQCRWPTTDHLPHLFCGLRQMAGRSYCATHYRTSIGEGTASERAAIKLPKMAA